MLTRTRKTDDQGQTVLNIDEYLTTGGHNHYVQNMATIGRVKTISDDPHKGQAVKQRMAKGEVVMGSLAMSTKERQYASGHVSYVSTSGYHVEYDGDIAAIFDSIAPGPTLPMNLDAMSQVAFMKALAKTRNEGIMSGELASDMAQTVGMLKSPFGTARALIEKTSRYAKTRYGKTYRSVAVANAHAWLEFQYGWKPLLLDSMQAVHLAQTFRQRLGERLLVVRATEKDSVSGSKQFSGISPPSGNYTFWKASGSKTAGYEASANAGVLFRTKNRTPAQQLVSDSRLGLDSLIQTGWEVIPYSFVVDWFVRVGPWLEAVVPNPDITIMGSWVTTVVNYTQSVNITSITGRTGAGITESGTGGYSTYKENTVTRNIEPVLPSIPPVNYKLNSLAHAISGVSLLLPPILKGLNGLRH